MENFDMVYDVAIPSRNGVYTNEIAKKIIKQFIDSGKGSAMFNAKSVYSGSALKMYQMCYQFARNSGKCSVVKRGSDIYLVRTDKNT